jgi:hypothetical protein
MKYPDDMDKECIRLCDAMNRFPGIMTYESCCGHGKKEMGICFLVTGHYKKDLPPILYHFDRCHTGVSGWRVEVHTDCAMDGVRLSALSESVGEKAYKEADKIAECMEGFLAENEIL